MSVTSLSPASASASASSVAAGRHLPLEATRLVMALLVVGLHGRLLADISPAAWYAVAEGAGRVAVPFFFFLSGYYFDLQVKRGFRRWLLRLVTLYAVWTALYTPLWLRFDTSLPELIYLLANGYLHLWYLVALAGGGVILHGLHHRSTALLFWLAALCFGFGVTLQYAINVAAEPGQMPTVLLIPLVRNLVTFGFPMLCFGFLLARIRQDPASRLGRLAAGRMLYPAAMLAMGLFAVEVGLNFVLFGGTGIRDLYASLPLVTAAIFLLVQRIPSPGGVAWLGAASAAVYFVHPWILQMLRTAETGGATAISLAAMLVSLGIAPAIIWINRRGLPLL